MLEGQVQIIPTWCKLVASTSRCKSILDWQKQKKWLRYFASPAMLVLACVGMLSDGSGAEWAGAWRFHTQTRSTEWTQKRVFMRLLASWGLFDQTLTSCLCSSGAAPARLDTAPTSYWMDDCCRLSFHFFFFSASNFFCQIFIFCDVYISLLEMA